MTKMKFKIVVFQHGKRVERSVTDPRKAARAVEILNERPHTKAHLVNANFPYWKFYYPPDNDSLEALNDGMLWCPYCRRWRWFSIPRYSPEAIVGSTPWFLNSYYNQGITICQWCTISEDDFYVRRANGLTPRGTRRRRRNRRRRKR